MPAGEDGSQDLLDHLVLPDHPAELLDHLGPRLGELRQVLANTVGVTRR